ncbi:MAG: helix-turn-helix transcriptional regulator [Clostridia bacterium]|nr:helix-turn-helix transcriptional regulator [Clostridia bacterium]
MLSEKIKSLRLAGNYSQVDIAEKLSVTKQTVSNWENNNIQPSVDMLVKIADLFGVSTDYLLGRDMSPKLDVSGLSEIEIQHLNMIINDIRNKNPQV